MPTPHFDPDARADLEELWSYIAKDNPDAADTYLDEIYQKTQQHADHPYMGKSEPTLAKRLGIASDRLRSFLYRNHRCYYLTGTDTIWVLGYIHSRRNRDRLFRERFRRLRDEQ
ncbi:MAG: type II toxin-antitoxin system RelE/ParE family toxin [Deltaproteobacteria bacterium]|nr:type II toxin-antitoxin system RelE/ParE family toxin [Deltaproteobacteria bacterium]